MTFNNAVWTRLELATPCVTGRYSNQLNYQTNFPNQPKRALTTVRLLGNCYHTFRNKFLAVLSGGKYTTPFHFRKLFFKKNEFYFKALIFNSSSILRALKTAYCY